MQCHTFGGHMSTHLALGEGGLSLQILFSAMPVAMALIDREGRHVAINQALAGLSGLPVEELIGRPVADLSPESGANIARNFASFDAGEDVPDHELELGNRSYWVSVKPLRDATGYAIGLMVALTDITQQKETEQKLKEANAQLAEFAQQDALTGLGNRRFFDSELLRCVLDSARECEPLSLIMIDVDHFKDFNDSHGHPLGDEALRRIARVLKQTVTRPLDMAFRYGGEEFVVLLSGTPESGATHLAETIRASVQALGIPHSRSPLRSMTVSLGIATVVASPMAPARTAEQLVTAADQALYQAKAAGRNTWKVINGESMLECSLPSTW